MISYQSFPFFFLEFHFLPFSETLFLYPLLSIFCSFINIFLLNLINVLFFPLNYLFLSFYRHVFMLFVFSIWFYFIFNESIHYFLYWNYCYWFIVFPLYFVFYSNISWILFIKNISMKLIMNKIVALEVTYKPISSQTYKYIYIYI